RGRRRAGAALLAAALGPVLLLAAVFPTGGHEPFAFSAFLPVPLFALAFIYLLPARERALRVGAALYALAATAALVIHTPLGSNVVRLGALVAGPLLACAIVSGERRPRLAGARGRVGAAVVVAFLGAFTIWQWSAGVRDLRKAYEDPSAQASYYRPLVDHLDRVDAADARIEIPFTRN